MTKQKNLFGEADWNDMCGYDTLPLFGGGPARPVETQPEPAQDPQPKQAANLPLFSGVPDRCDWPDIDPSLPRTVVDLRGLYPVRKD